MNRMISEYSSFPGAPGGSNRYSIQETPSHPLQAVLSHLLRNNSSFVQMEQDLSTASSGFGQFWSPNPAVDKVLTQMEAPSSLPEAPQPPGFVEGIVLHNYQRCAP